MKKSSCNFFTKDSEHDQSEIFFSDFFFQFHINFDHFPFFQLPSLFPLAPKTFTSALSLPWVFFLSVSQGFDQGYWHERWKWDLFMGTQVTYSGFASEENDTAFQEPLVIALQDRWKPYELLHNPPVQVSLFIFSFPHYIYFYPFKILCVCMCVYMYVRSQAFGLFPYLDCFGKTRFFTSLPGHFFLHVAILVWHLWSGSVVDCCLYCLFPQQSTTREDVFFEPS